jgi:biopolymer transport protein ExbD
MFVVSNIFNDTMIALREQDFRLRVLSNVISAVDVVLWLMMFFVLFRSVDDVRVP